MIEIGDIVQINCDLTGTQLKMGMSGVIVHKYDEQAYEIEPLDDLLDDCTFAVQSEQLAVIWSVKEANEQHINNVV